MVGRIQIVLLILSALLTQTYSQRTTDPNYESYTASASATANPQNTGMPLPPPANTSANTFPSLRPGSTNSSFSPPPGLSNITNFTPPPGLNNASFSPSPTEFNTTESDNNDKWRNISEIITTVEGCSKFKNLDEIPEACAQNLELYKEYLNNNTVTENQTQVIFDRLAQLPPQQISDVLRQTGVLALNSRNLSQQLQIITSTFHYQAHTIPPQNQHTVALPKFNLNLPPLNLDGTAVSVISWASNPYSAAAPTNVHTNVVSISLSKSSGSELATKHLETPIQLTWLVNSSSLNPSNLSVNCINSDQNVTVPCPDINITYTCPSANTTMLYTCPTPKSYTATCLYWNTTYVAWDTYGCYPVSANTSTIVCNCSHLTDFSARLTSVYTTNLAILTDAPSVYSLAGLQKYYHFYIIFGSIALVAVLALGIGLYLDIKDSDTYFNLLFEDAVVKHLHENGYIIDIYQDPKRIPDNKNYSPKSNETPVEDSPSAVTPSPESSSQPSSTTSSAPSSKNSSPSTPTPIMENPLYGKFIKPYAHHYMPERKITFMEIMWNRILLQHTQIGAFLRFDPRISRMSRLFLVFIGLFNSLFVTGFLYSYTYGLEVSVTMTLTDSFILSLITATLNYPCLIIMSYLVNLTGIHEFRHRYPILLDELIRRHKFESSLTGIPVESMIPQKIDITELKSHYHENEDHTSFNHTITVFFRTVHEYVLESIKIITCAPQRQKPSTASSSSLSKAYFYATKPYVHAQHKPPIRRYMPFHTLMGAAVFSLSIGWFAWCLNYLLLFSAYHGSNVSDSILTSFGINELETIVLIQPLTLLFYVLLGAGVRRFNKYACPQRTNNATINKSSSSSLPALFLTSDPFGAPDSTAFSTQFAYDIFVNIPSKISHTIMSNLLVRNLGYASVSSVIDYIESGSMKYRLSDREAHIIALYNYINKAMQTSTYRDKINRQRIASVPTLPPASSTPSAPAPALAPAPAQAQAKEEPKPTAHIEIQQTPEEMEEGIIDEITKALDPEMNPKEVKALMKELKAAESLLFYRSKSKYNSLR